MQVKLLKMRNGRKVSTEVLKNLNADNLKILANEIYNELNNGYDFLINIGGKEISFVRPMPLKVIATFVR